MNAPFGYRTDTPPLTAPLGRRVYFNAVLIPNRSLSRKGFLAVMLAVGTLSFVAGLVFFLAGAWPVLGFLGLDVLAVFLAFRLDYRRGGAREYLQLRDDALELRRVNHAGRERRFQIEPAWLRVNLEHDDNGPTRLSLTDRGHVWTIGSFLAPAELEDISDALISALSARRAALPLAVPPGD